MTTPGDAPQAGSEHADSVSLEVPAEHAGARLDQFLTDHLPGWTRSRIQRLIREGRVHLDRTAARPGAGVRGGDSIRVDIPPAMPATPRPEALALDIVHDDPDLVVVNKPAGMVVHPAAGHAGGTLVNALLHHVRDLSGIGGELRPGIVHRLDRGTSGLMVVAKHDGAHAELARQFSEREIEKEYVALVWGVVRQGRRIDLPIGRDPVDRKKISARSRRAREAVTRITGAEPLDGVTLVRVAIATGRTHQIRVHLSAIGHPVVGDSMYGGRRRHPPAHLRIVQRLERPFLHASGLAFKHPRDGRRIAVSCELPYELQDLADRIRTVTRRRAAAGPAASRLDRQPGEPG